MLRKWLASVMLIAWLSGMVLREAHGQTIQEDKQRYLSVMILNIGNGEDWEIQGLDQMLQNGCNSALITVGWEQIYKTKTSAANWSTIDKELAIARKYKAKIALRVMLGRSRVDASGNEWWPAEAALKDHTGGLSYQGGFPYGHQPTVDLAMGFAKEVAQRYEYLQKEGNLIFMSAVFNPTQEAGYHYTNQKNWSEPHYFVQYDYSSVAVRNYRAWLQNKFKEVKTLNAKWGSDYTSFEQVLPASSEVSKPKVTEAQLDWYRFRHGNVKNALVAAAKTFKGVNANIKVINEFGSVFDQDSYLRATLAFPDLAEFSDGTKINNDGSYPHKFSADLTRTNSPGKWIMNEVFMSKEADYWDMVNEFDSHFAHGCKMVAYVLRGAGTKPDEVNYMKPIVADIKNNWLSKPMVAINPTQTIEIKLSDLFNRWGWYNDYIAQWNELYAQNRQPINVRLIDDVINPNNNTNQKPVLNKTMGDRTVFVQEAQSIEIPADLFIDRDGRIVKYEITGLPTGLKQQGNTIIGVPTTVGNYTISITATDDKAEATTTSFLLSIRERAQLNFALIKGGYTNQRQFIKYLSNNESLDLTNWPFVNVFVESTGSTPVVIKMVLTGPTERVQLETDAPFALYGDNGGIKLTPGKYKLAAIAYSSKDLGDANIIAKSEVNFSIFEQATNRPPVVLYSLAEQQGKVGSMFSYTVPVNAFSDPEGNTLRPVMTGLPAGLSQSGWSISGTPIQAGVYTVTVQVFDALGASASTTFVIRITSAPLNTSPKIVQALPNQTAVVGESFKFTIPLNYFSDPDGYIVRLIALGLPSGLSFETGSVVGVPSVAGVYAITIRAYDNSGLYVDSPFKLTVSSKITNQPPTVSVFIPNQSATVGQAFSYTIPSTTFKDPEGLALTIAVQNLPLGLSFAGTTISGTPAQAGSFTVNVTATDPAGRYVLTNFLMDIKLPTGNQPPVVVRTMADQTFVVNANVSLVIPANLFSDPDGYVSVMTVTGLPSGLSYTLGVISGKPTQIGKYAITIKAFDNLRASTFQVFNINIVPASNTRMGDKAEPVAPWVTYPNPYKNSLMVTLPIEYQSPKTKFTLVNTSGQQTSIHNLKWLTNKVELYPPNVPKGTYTLVVQNTELPSKFLKVMRND